MCWAMAANMAIDRVERTPTHSVYVFTDNDLGAPRSGRLRINHDSGEIETLEPMPKDTNLNREMRARRKLTVHWRSGELPDRTCWAS